MRWLRAVLLGILAVELTAGILALVVADVALLSELAWWLWVPQWRVEMGIPIAAVGFGLVGAIALGVPRSVAASALAATKRSPPPQV